MPLPASASFGAASRRLPKWRIRSGPARQIGLELRQPAGDPGEEAVVEPPHPGPRRAGDHRAAPARPGHRAQLGEHVDDAEAGDEIGAHAAVDRDRVDAGAQVDRQAEQALQLVRGEDEAVAGQPLRRDPEQALDAQIGEDAAGDVADPGHPPRGRRSIGTVTGARDRLPAPFARAPPRSRSCRTRSAARSADRRSARVPNGPSSRAASRTCRPVMLGNRAGGRSSSAAMRDVAIAAARRGRPCRAPRP